MSQVDRRLSALERQQAVYRQAEPVLSDAEIADRLDVLLGYEARHGRAALFTEFPVAERVFELLENARLRSLAQRVTDA